jgi:hypothetical protein
MSSKTTVLFNPRKITLMYTMSPFWRSSLKSEFVFTTDLDWVLKKDTNNSLMMVGWLKHEKEPGAHAKLLQVLRPKYESLIYFDDNDGTECHFLHLLEYFDLFYKKQLFADRSKYMESFYGKRIYSDFYHKTMGITESPAPEPLQPLTDPAQLSKLRISWNLAFGQYPASKVKAKLASKLYPYIGPTGLNLLQSKFPSGSQPPSPTLAKCHARFQIKTYRTSVSFQRKLFQDITKDHPDFLTGMVPLNQYNREIQTIQATLSPFGWGELCFRDIEAILNGSVILKPQMDHVETWPNIYLKDETFVSIKWDGSDLLEKAEDLLRDKEKRDYIRNRAWNELTSGYLAMETRVEQILEEIRSLRKSGRLSAATS